MRALFLKVKHSCFRFLILAAATATISLLQTTNAWVQESLSISEVKRVLAQAIHEARTRGVGAAIAVSDRSGNILAVYNMIGANRQFNAAGADCTVGLSNIPVGCVVVTSDPKQPNGVPQRA